MDTRYIDKVSRYTRVDALLLLLVVVDGELGGDPVHGAGQLGQGVAGLLPVQQHVYTISSQHHDK